jgi:type II secretory pathway pseudopilin PulG
MPTTASEKGFTLLETMVALGVLTAGVLGVAAIITTGMKNLSSSPADVIVTQKAAQAVEAVFSARDSHRLTWAQIRNVNGGTGSDGGVFLDGPQNLHQPGPDGLVNTSDDLTAIETVTNPGFDQLLGTADDRIDTLSAYRREISIRDVPGENGNLRSIVVTMTYRTGSAVRTYTLSSFISSYS